MDPGHVKLSREGSMVVVTLDRPPVNALTTTMIEDMGRTFDGLENDSEVGVIILTGAGNNAFCAGGDIQEMSTIEPAKALDVIRRGSEIFWKIEHCEKSVIAAINGFAMGAGLELAMACDVRVASDRARFSQPEVNLGMIPGYGGTQRLAHLVGKAKAKELIMTGRTIRADEALRMGLVNQVVPDGEELRAAKDMATQILSRAPLAVRASKKAINEGLEKPYRNGFITETQYFGQLLDSEDLKEGIRAFLEKRQPKWKGK